MFSESRNATNSGNFGHRERQTCREPWVNTACTLTTPSVRDSLLEIESLGQTGLPLCKIRRKPAFVTGTNLGLSQEQPDRKVYVYVPFSCLNFGGPFW